MKDIGLALKNARENKDFTQKKVMELTGINKKSLSGYENNIAEPDLSTFSVLANLYGISADDILEIKHFSPSHAHSKKRTSIPLSKKETTLLFLFGKLDPAHQNELLVIVNALANHLNRN